MYFYYEFKIRISVVSSILHFLRKYFCFRENNLVIVLVATGFNLFKMHLADAALSVRLLIRLQNNVFSFFLHKSTNKYGVKNWEEINLTFPSIEILSLLFPNKQDSRQDTLYTISSFIIFH